MLFSIDSISALGAILLALAQLSIQSAPAGQASRGLLGRLTSAPILRRQTPGTVPGTV